MTLSFVPYPLTALFSINVDPKFVKYNTAKAINTQRMESQLLLMRATARCRRVTFSEEVAVAIELTAALANMEVINVCSAAEAVGVHTFLNFVGTALPNANLLARLLDV